MVFITNRQTPNNGILLITLSRMAASNGNSNLYNNMAWSAIKTNQAMLNVIKKRLVENGDAGIK